MWHSVSLDELRILLCRVVRNFKITGRWLSVTRSLWAVSCPHVQCSALAWDWEAGRSF